MSFEGITPNSYGSGKRRYKNPMEILMERAGKWTSIYEMSNDTFASPAQVSHTMRLAEHSNPRIQSKVVPRTNMQIHGTEARLYRYIEGE